MTFLIKTRPSLLKGLILVCLLLTILLHLKIYKMKQFQNNFHKFEAMNPRTMENGTQFEIFSHKQKYDINTMNNRDITEIVENKINTMVNNSKNINNENTTPKSNNNIVHSDNISGYYGKLGIKVKKYIFSKVFLELAGPDTNTSTMKNQIHSDKRESIIPEILLEYPDFKISIPNFVSEDDKKIFLMMHSNIVHLGYRGHKKLKGHLAIIPQISRLSHQDDCGWRNNITDYMKTPKDLYNTQKDTTIYSNLLVPDSFAFQHFIDGSLPKIVQLLPFLNNQHIKLIVFRPRDTIVNEIIEKIGIKKDRLIFYDYNKHTVNFQLNGCITPPLHPILWDKMREVISVTKHLTVPIFKASVILLTRAGNRNGGRSIRNKKQVIHYLTMRYGKNLHIFKGGYSLERSLQIFGKARIILGVHGGAFYNLNFCPQETVIVEYQPINISAHLAHTIMWSMAEIIGQKYYRLYEKSITSHGDVNISILKLKKVLDEVDTLQNISRSNAYQ